MRTQMMTSILNCVKCKVFERREPKAPLCNIVALEPMDLIHVDLLGLETTMDPQDHAFSTEDTSRNRPLLTPHTSLQSTR